ncbi:hypothetical protein TanjilG_27327 [Lupinus angustifolius]|uniref:J domain-containing protein n=1 Tax=Lupinus angustifolius TaxID=3871 RepID=A0A1J7HGT3_LUPAN|nr:hypothetical protein TanjilG_27327 [Lupinus angustifolius]
MTFLTYTTLQEQSQGRKTILQGNHTIYSGEIPTLLRSSNDTSRINMSYLMVNQGSDVAQVHVVPAYTCLIEEVNHVKVNIVKKSVPVAHDAYSGIHCNEGINEGGHCTKSFIGPSPDNTKKQSSNIEVKVKNRSDSIDLFFDASEISNGSNGTHHVKVPPSETVAGNLDNQNDDDVISTATKRQTSIRDTSEGAIGGDSPSYLDDNVDSNSEAAAFVAALRKAIEEAQVRMKLAKESMRRKKEGFPNRVKRKSNIDLKAEKKEEDKISCKIVNLEEITRQAFGEADAFPKVSSGVGKPTMRIEKVRLHLGAKEMLVAEAMQGTLKKLKSTLAKHKEEFEQKADDNAKVLDLKEEDWKQENNEEKVPAANEAGACEELLVNTRRTSQEVVDETKLVQKTLHKGSIDKGLRVNGEGEVKSKKKMGKRLKNGKENLRAIQEFREIEKNIDQVQKGNEEKVEVSSEPEECELLQFLEPMDKRACSPHGLYSKSLEREIENLGCSNDRKGGCEAGFLDVNGEAEHSCQREGAKNMFSNTYVHAILEEIVDHIHDEEDIYLRIMKDSELDGNERVQDSEVSKNEIEGATLLMEENEGGREDNKEPVEENEKNPTEKAAMEAKLKTERAVVERATAEARARALQRALSEKAASESRNKSNKSIAEKLFGASRDNGMKQNFHSKSFRYGVCDSTDVFDGADGDSTQRCKARSERHQRIGRVAKALAEKNMRDRLVQKEQKERNRIAGALDADVKRWSSGKTGNLRALLSTLQYILGADSGWQPIPLTDIVMSSSVKKAYRKATLFVHPGKLQQWGASIQQKYICEKVFDLLKVRSCPSSLRDMRFSS